VPARLAIAIALSLAVGSIGVLLWLEEMVGDRAALLAALVYLALPYHLGIDVYYRAAFAELWAFAWAPWTLFAVHRIGRAPLLHSTLLAAFLAALALSHAPSALMVPPAVLLYAVAVALVERRPAIVLVTLAALALSGLLAAAYLATALGHGDQIKQADLFDGMMRFSNWLLFGPEPWPNRRMQRLVTWIFLVQAGLALGLGGIAAWHPGGARRWVWAPLLLALGSLFLMTVWSAPLWHALPVLQKVQFPYRLLLLNMLALAALAGLAAEACRRLPARTAFWARAAMAGGLVAALLLNAAPGIMVVKDILARKPRTVAMLQARTADASEYVLGDHARLATLFQGDGKVAVLRGAGAAAVTAWRPRHLALEVDARTPLTLAVRQFRYAGWQAAVDGSAPQPADACASLGIVCTMLPPGRHRLTFELLPTWHERLGTRLSQGGLAVLVAMLALASVRRWQGWARPPPASTVAAPP
jgi:hypothetical protein